MSESTIVERRTKLLENLKHDFPKAEVYVNDAGAVVVKLPQFASQPKPAHLPLEGSIYVVGAFGYVKIGWTGNEPKRRIENLQTGFPEPLQIVATFPGSIKIGELSL